MSTEKTINTRIKLKRDEESNWDSQNPIILNGEVVLVDGDDGRLRAKIGDGTSTYSALGFIDHIHVITEDNKEDSIPQNAILVVDTTEESMTSGGNADFGTLKYKDANGQWRTVGAGLHTHSPSSIGAAEAEHPHDVATADNDGFLSSTDKTKIDNLNDTVFGNTDKNIKSLVNLVGDEPVSEQIAVAIADRVIDIPGKGLSTEDYTTAEKTKLANIDPYANNYELPVAGKDTLGGVKTTSTVTSSSGYTACPIVNGVPYYKNTNTQNTAGASNTSNKIYLIGATSQSTSPTTYSHDTVYVGTDGCLYSGGVKVSDINHSHTVDSALSSTSTNPVQNKVVYAIDNKVGPDPVSEQISDHADEMASTTTSGHMSKEDKIKLDGLKNYEHPLYTAKSSALYKVTVDSTGHISGTTAVQKSDITALGIPSSDTTYSNATTSKAGLMSATDKTKLDNITEGATKVVVDSTLSATSTNPVQNKVVYTIDQKVGPDPVSEQISDHADEMASTTTSGHMSKEDKIKLDGLTNYTHPANHPASMITGLANVATTGSYNDLTNKPTIPSAYTHPTTAGNKHIPTGGSSGQILRYSSSGTAKWGNETTYSNATTSAAGLMSSTDKKKLDGMSYSYGTSDLTAGSSSLTTGSLYFVYE